MTISELKKDAKVKLSGSYKKAFLICLIYYALIFALTYVVSFINNTGIRLIFDIAIAIISVPLSFGIISTFIKIVRNEDVAILDFLKIGFSNFKGAWRTYLRTIVNLILPIILLVASYILFFYTLFIQVISEFSQESNVENPFLIAISSDGALINLPINLLLVSIILVLATAVFYIYKSLSYSLTLYILHDKPTATGKEINNESKKLMKGNKWKIFLLTLSFIGWMLLILLVSYLAIMLLGQTAGYIVSSLGTIILSPYISASLVCFYEDLKDENNENQKDEPVKEA